MNANSKMVGEDFFIAKANLQARGVPEHKEVMVGVKRGRIVIIGDERRPEWLKGPAFL